MATGVNAVCVKCKITQENQADKVLKCYGGCSNFIHYVCSAFKPTELKLFDTHNNNVKWCCDNCGREKKGTYVSDLYSKILDMDKKIDRMFSIIYEQSIKIEKQNNIIKKLEVSSSSEQQTKVEQTTLRGPTTRSKNILTESSKDTKSYAKSLSTQSNKNQTIQDKHTEVNNLEHSEKQKETQLGMKDIKTGNLQQTPARRNPNKTKTIRGNRNDTTISAAENRRWIFVSQLLRTTTENDVHKYLMENNINVIQCSKLEIRNTDIAAFKIAVAEDIYERMFEPELWPVNVIIRPYKFRNFRKEMTQSTNT